MRRFLLMLGLLLAAPASPAETAVHMVVRNSPLAGFRYNDGRRVWDEMRVGDALGVIREPENAFDAAAIRLEWQGHKIGYVPRSENSALARVLDSGTAIEARIIELAKRRNGRHLVSYDILIPLQTAQHTHEKNSQ